jgi:hypothetical protein
MTKEEVSQFAEIPALGPMSVKCKTSNHGGFFDLFPDSAELKEQNKWRFIPTHLALAFQKERETTKLANPKHSIILNGSDIISIKYM